MPKNGSLPTYLSVDQFAYETDTCTKTVRRQIRKGTIPAKRFGDRILIPRSALDNLPDVPNAGTYSRRVA